MAPIGSQSTPKPAPSQNQGEQLIRLRGTAQTISIKAPLHAPLTSRSVAGMARCIQELLGTAALAPGTQMARHSALLVADGMGIRMSTSKAYVWPAAKLSHTSGRIRMQPLG